MCGSEEVEVVVGEGGLSRRGLLRMGVAAAAGSAVAVAGGVANPLVAGAALPSVWMERMCAQAQVESRYGNSGLPGAFGVKEIQKALRAKGYGTTVDGWYGAGTAADYRAWQRRLGYRGLDANGIPGVTSLTKLGNNRFTVARKVHPGGRDWNSMWIGGRSQDPRGAVNERTRRMVNEARSMIGWDIIIVKAGYLASDGNSSYTHTGAALDIRTYNLSYSQRWRTVKALRRVGFAAWFRPANASWGQHIHAVPIADPDLSYVRGSNATAGCAAHQVADYYRGKNGLANHAGDNTPSSYRVPFTWWERYLRST